MRKRLKRAWSRAKYAAIGAAVGGAAGGLFSKNSASTGAALGALVGATVGEKRVTVGSAVKEIRNRDDVALDLPDGVLDRVPDGTDDGASDD